MEHCFTVRLQQEVILSMQNLSERISRMCGNRKYEIVAAKLESPQGYKAWHEIKETTKWEDISWKQCVRQKSDKGWLLKWNILSKITFFDIWKNRMVNTIVQ